MPKVVVIGLGRFGSACATRLYDEGAEVLAIDRNRGAAEAVKDAVTAAIACDATRKENLEAYDVASMDAAVVAMGDDFEASVLVTLLCRELGVPKVVAKAVNAMQRQVLFQLGADQVVMPEEEMGARLADHVLRESIVDFVELPAGFSLRRVPAPDDWVGATLNDLQLLQRWRLNVVQVVRPPRAEDGTRDPHDEDTEHLPLPDGATVIQEGDLLDVIAPDDALDRLRE